MKIALTTIGSRGDIQPFLALGYALQKNGYDVSILTHPWAKKLCNEYQLSHIAVGDDIDMNDSVKQIIEKSSNNLIGHRFTFINFMIDKLKKCHSDFLSELKDFDLIIAHEKIGNPEAEILQKPCIIVSIAPGMLQKEYWKTKKIIKEFRVFLRDKINYIIFGTPLSKYRKSIGVPLVVSVEKYPYLALVPISRLLQRPNLNWKKGTRITGFFFADTPLSYKPSARLLNFLNNAETTILITFGSMYHKQNDTINLFNIVCEAVKASNSKAILLMPDLDEKEINVPENIFLVKQVPYSWLLDKVSVVVHHFGFGTTAEVLKAGIPSIPIPHLVDQKFRADLIHKLGLAAKPLNIKKINSTKLADSIRKVKTDIKMKERCTNAGNVISKENGLNKAISLINKFINDLE